MATLFGVQYADGSAGSVQDLERAKAIVSYDPARRKVVKLTVEDYVPPKKYKWKVTTTLDKPNPHLTKSTSIYEGVEDTRLLAETRAKAWTPTYAGYVSVTTIEEIDG